MSAVESPAETLVAGRYRLLEWFGGGGEGEVWTAVDTLTSEAVAVKRVPIARPSDLPRLRREVTALRWLRLPGVVELRDEWVENDSFFLVEEWVEGQPYLGATGRADWDAVAPTTLALLGTLARCHEAGIVHGDLKPPNILVRPDGRPVVLDFGIAAGRALPARPAGVSGTESYMAPEVWSGGQLDARTDLYAIGVMLYEALTDSVFSGFPGMFPPSVPPEVAAVVASMVARDPSRRPASAEAALAALGGSVVRVEAGLAADRPATREELMELFAGPDAFLHLREDGASLLWGRTQGDPAAVAREIEAWCDAGLARRIDGLIHVDRAGLEQLETPAEEAGLRAAMTAGADTATVIAEAERVAAHWSALGRTPRAVAVLELAIARARQDGLAEAEERLVVQWAPAVLAQESAGAIEHALYVLGCSQLASPVVEQCLHLVFAAQTARRGEGARARQLLAGVPEFEDEGLEVWRAAMTIRAAARLVPSEEETALASFESWANTPFRRSKWLGWLGNLRYRQGRFAQAATLHQASADGKRDGPRHAWISSLYNAALALLELPDLEQARTIAEDVATRAAAARLVHCEAEAALIVRCADYRAGLSQPPRPELVEAAAPIGAWLAAHFAFAEAAIAWRFGALDTTARLARQASEGFRQLGSEDCSVLAEALSMATGPVDFERACVLAGSAAAPRAPEFGVQALGLLWRAVPNAPAEWRLQARRLAACRPESVWNARLDILSFAEAVGDHPALE